MNEGKDVIKGDIDNWYGPRRVHPGPSRDQDSNKRNPDCALAMKEGAEAQEIEDQAISAHNHPGHVKRWINHPHEGGEG
ncbi:hypothetical protein BGX33_005698 [Mortierella sp. NVP41]|nr:hypothetical protein BGX33_005698 [Mortierella sp. NVP41]